MKKTNILLLVLAIAVVIFIIIAGGNKSDELLDANDSLVLNDNAVVLADQNAGADIVTVSYVKLAKPGYVAVYTFDSDKQNKELAGVSEFLSAGEHFNVKVPVTRKSGDYRQSVVAQIHEETTNDTQFDAEADTAVVDDSGTEISSEAEIGDDLPNAEDIDVVEEVQNEGYMVDQDVADDLSEDTGTPDDNTGTEMTEDGGTTDEEVVGDEMIVPDDSSVTPEDDTSVEENTDTNTETEQTGA
ncbi:MAG: hypothetical protein R3B64_02840 [Candidatus Paceibacterota bacterium]